jgi:hypothetical protein
VGVNDSDLLSSFDPGRARSGPSSVRGQGIQHAADDDPGSMEGMASFFEHYGDQLQRAVAV